METSPPNDVKAVVNEPRELLSRLYREIGLSAVAAALEPSALADLVAAHASDKAKPRRAKRNRKAA